MNDSLKFRTDNTDGYGQSKLDTMNDELESRLIESGINPDEHRDNLEFEEFQLFQRITEEIHNKSF